MQGHTPSVKLAARGTELTCILGSSVLRRGQPDSGESCIVLHRGRTCSLVSKFPQRSVATCSTRILYCKGRTLQTKPRMGVCKPLMPDVVAPKVHQNNRSYVSSVDLPLDSLRENLAGWAVTQRTLKNHKTVKIGGWALARVWALARDNMVHPASLPLSCTSSQPWDRYSLNDVVTFQPFCTLSELKWLYIIIG